MPSSILRAEDGHADACSTAWVSSTKMAGAAGGGVLGSAWGVRATPGLDGDTFDFTARGGRACRDNGYTYRRPYGTASLIRAWSRATSAPARYGCALTLVTTPSKACHELASELVDTISRIRGSSCNRLTARPGIPLLVADTEHRKASPVPSHGCSKHPHQMSSCGMGAISLNKPNLHGFSLATEGVRPTESRRADVVVLPAMRVTGRLLSATFSCATLDRRGAFGRHFGDVGGRLGTGRSEGGLLSTLTSCRGGYFQRV